MQVSDLYASCSRHVRDPLFLELSEVVWTDFIADASRDARSAGWYLNHEDDSSIVIAQQTYSYAVPQEFANIEKLMREETINSNSIYVTEIPKNEYEVRLSSSGPMFEFNTVSALETDKHIKIVGQKRPTIYVTKQDTIDLGMEAFMRERALYFAFRYLGAGGSEYARWRQVMAQQCWQTSEAWLRRHPQEFRMSPSAMVVPGRG